MIKKTILALFTLSLMMGCNSTDDGNSGGSQGDGFDRQDMLINWADNIIIPAYQDLNSDLIDLSTKKETFVNLPNQANLKVLRSSWLQAYKTWQYLEMFSIGKAEEINYVFQMNVYPTNVMDIEANIASGTYDLSIPNNNDAVGFPALDYMLFGLAENDTQIIDAYTNATNAEANKTYLSDVVNQMQTLTETVLNDWTSSYRDTFVNNTGNTATSTTNKLTNDYIFYYEKQFRKNKFGVPSGVFSTSPLPDKVEGFYSEEYSKALALQGLNAVQDFFNGKAYNSNATAGSFKSYLEYLNTINNGENVGVLINSRLNAAKAKIEILNNNFAQQVETDNAKMTEAFDAIQQVVILFKIDMVQAMDIQFDFVDNDGD